MYKNSTKAFTLIELLVVISIIGLLSSVILTALSQAKTKAQIARAQQEIRQIANAMITAKIESQKYMWQINSGPPPLNATFESACTNACAPSPCITIDLRNVAPGHECYVKWAAVLDSIEANSGGVFPNLDVFRRDPWGSPYVIDENEGVSGTQCGTDYVRSAGPDGINNGGVDDIFVRLPFTSLGKRFLLADNPLPAPPTFDLGRQCTCTNVDVCTE